VQKRVEECFRVISILFATVWYVLRVGMLFRVVVVLVI
jgi:hypothetical protein